MSINKEVYNIVEFLKDTLRASGTNGFALGMSGGIDSSVCAALAKRAIDELNREPASPFGLDDVRNPPYLLDLIILPMGNQPEDADTAIEVMESLEVKGRTVDLASALIKFCRELHGFPITVEVEPHNKLIGNLKARMRMTAIYYAANDKNLLVLGTDNLSETYTGYFTKHGDGAADVFPLSEFTKREVYELGSFLNLPASVLTRKPSAGLWEGQTDEDEMGIPYDFIDNHLEGLNDLNRATYSVEDFRKYREKLDHLHRNTMHKRAEPHVFKRNPQLTRVMQVNS